MNRHFSLFIHLFQKKKKIVQIHLQGIKKEVVMTDEETRLSKVDRTEVEPTAHVSLIPM